MECCKAARTRVGAGSFSGAEAQDGSLKSASRHFQDRRLATTSQSATIHAAVEGAAFCRVMQFGTSLMLAILRCISPASLNSHSWIPYDRRHCPASSCHSLYWKLTAIRFPRHPHSVFPSR